MLDQFSQLGALLRLSLYEVCQILIDGLDMAACFSGYEGKVVVAFDLADLLLDVGHELAEVVF